MVNQLLIKVCGMKEQQNIQALLELPIDYIGHIFYQKSNRFVAHLNPQDIPQHIKKTGVFVNADLVEIKSIIQQYKLDAIQLHGEESVELVRSLKNEQVEIIKAFGIDDYFDWHAISPFLDEVDYLLFDTKSHDFGGTGKTFNWQKLQDYPYEKPYFLSGGISLDNIYEASRFQDKRCIGLDLNSKFEIEPGIKDIEKLKKALKIINHE